MVSCRGYMVLLLIGAGLLGAYWAARAQDRPPWPSRPIVPPDEIIISPPAAPPGSLPQLRAQPLDPSKEIKIIDLPDSPPSPKPPGPPRGPGEKPAEASKTPSAKGPTITELPVPIPKIDQGLANPDSKNTATVLIGAQQNAPAPGGPPPMPPPPFPPTKPQLQDPPAPRGGNNPPPEVKPENKSLNPAPLAGPKNRPLLVVPLAPENSLETDPRINVAEPKRPPSLRVVVPNRRLPGTFAEQEHISGFGSRPPLFGQGDISAPAVVVEKRGPSSVRFGQKASYEIFVRNRGTLPAQRIRVEDEILGGGRFTGGTPAPHLHGDRAVWLLDTLPPGGESRLIVEVQPASSGDILSTVTAAVSSSSIRTVVTHSPTPGRVNLVVNGPGQAVAGQTVDLEIRLTHTGSHNLTGLLLRVQLPKDKVTTSWGNEVEADIGTLAPGENKTIKLPVQAVHPGRHVILVDILAGQQPLANGQTLLVVTAKGLSLRQTGAARFVLDREGELQFAVANYQDFPARNVVVTHTLPEGLTFLGASDRGLFRPETRTVHWLVDYLAPTDSRNLTVQVQAKAPGQRDLQAVARAQGGEEIQARGLVTVSGVAALGLHVADRDDPLEVGKETVYEIRVVNAGNAPDTDVQVQAWIPEGLTPRKIQGPTSYRLEGRRVIFAPLSRLDGQGQAVYQLAALARSPGEQRLRVQVTSAQAPTPLTREERTLVYQD